MIGKELSKQSEKNSDVEGTPGATRFTFFKEIFPDTFGMQVSERIGFYLQIYANYMQIQWQTKNGKSLKSYYKHVSSIENPVVLFFAFAVVAACRIIRIVVLFHLHGLPFFRSISKSAQAIIGGSVLAFVWMFPTNMSFEK